jgi:hypothetical protein
MLGEDDPLLKRFLHRPMLGSVKVPGDDELAFWRAMTHRASAQCFKGWIYTGSSVAVGSFVFCILPDSRAKDSTASVTPVAR